jgi:hypothetical protein
LIRSALYSLNNMSFSDLVAHFPLLDILLCFAGPVSELIPESDVMSYPLRHLSLSRPYLKLEFFFDSVMFVELYPLFHIFAHQFNVA